MQKQCGHILRSISFSAAVNHTKPQVVVQSSENLRPNVNFPIEIKFTGSLLNKSDLFLKREREPGRKEKEHVEDKKEKPIEDGGVERMGSKRR